MQLKKIGLLIRAIFHQPLIELFRHLFTLIAKSFRSLFRLIRKLLHKSLIELLAFPFKGFKKITLRYFYILYPRRSRVLHTNACGDFTLLSAEDWKRLKGYPEWHCFSWHLDTVLLFQAKNHGIQEVDLPKKRPIFHIEHEIGSGYTPEGEDKLFKRLQSKGIPYLSNTDLAKVLQQLDSRNRDVIYNNEDWGLSSLTLEEFSV